MPIVLPHNAVHGCESQTCAFSLLLGRKERLKNVRLQVRLYANPRIAHRYQHVRSRFYLDVFRQIGVIQLCRTRFNDELTAALHRIPRIQSQVDQNLAELIRIQAYRSAVLVQTQGYLNLLADHPLQQFDRVPDHFIYRQQFGLNHLSARKCQ